MNPDEYYSCPACNRKASLKHHISRIDKISMYYGCTSDDCRHHFQVLRLSGQPDQIVAESPRGITVPHRLADKGLGHLVASMGCPSCARYGAIRLTMRRPDGYWRRHECPTHGAYYTCQTDDGVTVHRKQKSLLAAEL